MTYTTSGSRADEILRDLAEGLPKGEVPATLYGNRELLFLLGDVSFSSREPAGHNVESRQILCPWRNMP